MTSLAASGFVLGACGSRRCISAKSHSGKYLAYRGEPPPSVIFVENQPPESR
jgi:hypothetical protein